ncbi:hypothetical protein EDB85DRAFT_759325 [Lactarius pseudohatsudake]|nr:hypothetical protein EDB85DRAFT_759325 [Lactarius pseudohatsudake]
MGPAALVHMRSPLLALSSCSAPSRDHCLARVPSPFLHLRSHRATFRKLVSWSESGGGATCAPRALLKDKDPGHLAVRPRPNQSAELPEARNTYLSHRGRSIKDACMHAYVRRASFRQHTATRSCATGCADRIPPLPLVLLPPVLCQGHNTRNNVQPVCAPHRHEKTHILYSVAAVWGLVDMSTWHTRHPLVTGCAAGMIETVRQAPFHATPCRRSITPSSPSFPTRALH